MSQLSDNSIWQWIVHEPQWGNLAEWFSAVLGGVALILAVRAVALQKVSNERSETEERERQVSVYARHTSARQCSDLTNQMASERFGNKQWFERTVEIRHFGTVPATRLAVVTTIETKMGTKQVVFSYGDVLPGDVLSLVVGPVSSLRADHPFSIEFTSFAGRHWRRPFLGALEQVEHRSGEEAGNDTIELSQADEFWVLSGETKTWTAEHDDGSVIEHSEWAGTAFPMRNDDSIHDDPS